MGLLGTDIINDLKNTSLDFLGKTKNQLGDNDNILIYISSFGSRRNLLEFIYNKKFILHVCFYIGVQTEAENTQACKPKR